jgi:hypothetical protein
MTLLVALSTTLLLLASVLTARWWRMRELRLQYRKQLRSDAHVWGVEYDARESEEVLMHRVRLARAQGQTGDPLQTAARALRAQRERRRRTA